MKINKKESEDIGEVFEALRQSSKSNRLKEEKLRLLEIASNCSVPGEPSSRTIERAQEFKKYIQDND